jgi:hypothetical protein
MDGAQAKVFLPNWAIPARTAAGRSGTALKPTFQGATAQPADSRKLRKSSFLEP